MTSMDDRRTTRSLRRAGPLLGLLLGLALPVAAEPPPEDLRARLEAQAALERPARERLEGAALMLMESGWRADSLSLDDAGIRLHGARAETLRIAGFQGEEGLPRPWPPDTRLFDPAAVRRGAEAWLDAMDRRGYPFAQIWLHPLREERGLSLTAQLSAGPAGPLGELRVAGAKRLGEPFLRAMIDLDGDVPLSRTRARRARGRLLATGWFREVAEPELGWDPVTERVGVLFRVEERPRPNRVTALVGGGSGETSGALDLDLFSPFGQGRRWRVGANWQGRQRSRLDLLLSEPRLLGRRLAMDLLFERVKQDSTFLQLAVEMDLRLPLPAGWEGIAGIGYERSLFGLGGDDEDDAEMSRRRHRFGLSWRSLAGDPGRERRFRLHGDLLIKKGGLTGDEPESRQLAALGQGRWTWRLPRPWKLRLKGGGQMLWAPEGGFNVAELYPLGGAVTLRGYDEEVFRGDAVAHLAGEVVLGEPLELSVFLDYGWGRWRRTDAPESRFEGWGAGIGLLAPGERGRLSLSLAMGEGRRWEDVRVHLSLDTGF